MMQVWMLVVALNGSLLGVASGGATLEQCEAQAMHSTVVGQHMRGAAGLPGNGVRAYCIVGRLPRYDQPAPRPGVQV